MEGSEIQPNRVFYSDRVKDSAPFFFFYLVEVSAPFFLSLFLFVSHECNSCVLELRNDR